MILQFVNKHSKLCVISTFLPMLLKCPIVYWNHVDDVALSFFSRCSDNTIVNRCMRCENMQSRGWIVLCTWKITRNSSFCSRVTWSNIARMFSTSCLSLATSTVHISENYSIISSAVVQYLHLPFVNPAYPEMHLLLWPDLIELFVFVQWFLWWRYLALPICNEMWIVLPSAQRTTMW